MARSELLFRARVAFQIADELERRARGGQLQDAEHLAEKLEAELLKIREFLRRSGF